jgi:hypothetical protein
LKYYNSFHSIPLIIIKKTSRVTILGNPAASLKPVAFRPCLSTGLAFSLNQKKQKPLPRGKTPLTEALNKDFENTGSHYSTYKFIA